MKIKAEQIRPRQKGLYTPALESDACGIGLITDLTNTKSHAIVQNALQMLENMEHRGACGCEENTGDGAGITLQIPHEFFVAECSKLGFELPEFGAYGVGMLFAPMDATLRNQAFDLLKQHLGDLDLTLLGYRDVPSDNSTLGESAVAVEPFVVQVFIGSKTPIKPARLEQKLFVLRKYTIHKVIEALPAITDFYYFSSISYKTIIYKGQLTTYQVKAYYPDLSNPDFKSAIALVHSRFSTNTVPKWRLAQPFRYIAHNGEINTVIGNRNWWKSREALIKTSVFTEDELEMLLPIVGFGQSDSASFDNVMEFLVMCGRSIPEALMMMIPEAWEEDKDMTDPKRAFYEYHHNMMEPWDGPASMCFTDGIYVGATLDRNGLRPSRYMLTHDNLLIVASEAGVLPMDQARVKYKGRLQPGKLLIADLEKGRIIGDEELKNEICSTLPYRDWLNDYKVDIEDLSGSAIEGNLDSAELLRKQQLFGFTKEDLKVILGPMVKVGKDPIGSMGTDTPLAVLSHKSQHLANYFKQLFAQVTNPPIDPIRERSVMSLFSKLGDMKNILEPTAQHAQVIHLDQPILTYDHIAKLKFLDHKDFKSGVISIVFEADGQEGRLKEALDRICELAETLTKNGTNILILSDKDANENYAPIPSLLATGVIHHHLIRQGLRTKTSIVVESGEIRETHHIATLIGFGASAVHPYMAFESLIGLKQSGYFPEDYTEAKILKIYIKAAGKGILKIMSKIGISTLQSYQGAQIFEILGINNDVVDHCFTHCISRIEGIGYDGIAQEALTKHKLAYPSRTQKARLEEGGIYQWKRRGEFHLFNPQTIHLLQYSTRKGDYKVFKKYSKLINDQLEQACTLRGLIDFKEGNPISIDEVESVESILTRFVTGAMSFGSISHEAHSTLAIAMNRIGGKSNSGEGGEDEIRFAKKANGDWECSATKQIASGRFGVTNNYLTNATELQIKMAQGAKPGEGGQLPGHKVNDWIGRVRHSTPGVGLISPPPHHDIYSIEDLAQLIFDLKNANRAARINVKLVSKAGVGIIASGVAKAHADAILISGHDGGTGASPLSSIRHTGLPWELGLAESHQVLVKNKLRGRVTLQTDGQMRTGRDLAIATLLGAEEWGVATAALVVEGCIMMRKCHLNTCPVGIATQDEELRKRFEGDAQHVVNFFMYLAEELREIMAELGFRTINEMVGQVQFLKTKDNIPHWKYQKLDLSPILYKEEADESVALYKQEEQDHGIDEVLDWKLFEAAQLVLKYGGGRNRVFAIKNTDRAVGTMLSNEIAKKHGSTGFPEGTFEFHFRGSAGQSFGAFGATGIEFTLEGEANDYFGKGLSGGRLIVHHDRDATFDPSKNIIIGNVALYGGTSGEVYIGGMAGERFAVRNSGVKAVVQGIGDHGCEYMTGGIVVVLGETGKNFAAGMSGGMAFVYDDAGKFPNRCNQEMIDLDPMSEEDYDLMREMVRDHFRYTSSKVALDILQDWENTKQHFVKVMPKDYKRALQQKAEKAKAALKVA